MTVLFEPSVIEEKAIGDHSLSISIVITNHACLFQEAALQASGRAFIDAHNNSQEESKDMPCTPRLSDK